LAQGAADAKAEIDLKKIQRPFRPAGSAKSRPPASHGRLE
jgi:hypothetical protein